MVNVSSAWIAAPLGSVAVLVVTSQNCGLPEMFMFYALSVTAGVFIYISTSDLIPELREHSSGRFDIGHTLAILFGIISVAVMTAIV